MSSALVRYGSRALVAVPPALRRYRAIKNARRFASVVKFGWKNRRGIAKAIRSSYNTFKKARSYLRPQPSTKKTAEVVHEADYDNGKLVKTLYGDAIGFSDETPERTNNRVGNTVFFSGVKTCIQFKNLTGVWIKVHCALIQSKEGEVSPIGTKFFRDNSSNTTRVRDFENGHDSTEALMYNCMGINPDVWNIIWHKKKTLMPATEIAPPEDPNNKFFWLFERYTKIKKQITFNSATATINTQPFYICYWIEPIFATDLTADPIVNTVEVQTIFQAYIRNKF